MGTIRSSSSHSPNATEAAFGARLLLFRPVVVASLTICFCNPGLSGDAFYGIAFRLSFPAPRRGSGTECHSGIRGRNPGGFCNYQFNSGPKPICFLIPCDPVFERSFPVSSTC